MTARVMFVNHTGLMSGAERSLLDMLPCLTDRIAPLIVSPTGELDARLAQMGIRHIAIPAAPMSFRLDLHRSPSRVMSAARAVRSLSRVIARERPDVVVANSVRAGLLAGLAPRSSSTSLVVWVRDVLPAGWIARLVRGVTWSRADLVLANSTYVARAFEGSKANRNAHVIFNGVDPIDSDLNGLGAAGFVAGATPLRLAVVGQITPWKQQHLAIEVLRQLTGRGVETTLDIIGAVEFKESGRYDTVTYERQLHSQVAALSLADRVRFWGRREDARRLLGENHILLVPSTVEPFGRVVLEGMLAHNVVVATDAGGPAEIIEHGATGFLTPAGEPATWTSLILDLVRDWSSALAVSTSAHRAASSRFGRQQMADAFERVVLSGSGYPRDSARTAER